ncbi:unnamed protein product [Penicillium olsonii]|nr:unnamed protein product [Penicillium olsonii]
MDHNMSMHHGAHGQHGHSDGDDMQMSMSMVFTASTKITLLFSWWSTTSVTSYILTLLFLFLLVLSNRFLGILKLRLDLRRTKSTSDAPDVPKLSLPSQWSRSRHSKDRVSPLPSDIEHNNHNEIDHYGSLPSAPLLAPISRLPGSRDEGHITTSHVETFRPRRKWDWKQDGVRSLLEGLRALIGYALMLAVMTYNVGVLAAVIAGIVVAELFMGRYSPVPASWQDGACHDS